MRDASADAAVDRERAAVRGLLRAFEEAIRDARELEEALDLLQGDARRAAIAEISERLGHLGDVGRGRF